MTTTKNLQWYIPDHDKRQDFIRQLESCDTMNAVLLSIVKPMIADESLARVNEFTAGSRAFFDTFKDHLHLAEGGMSYSTYYRRFSGMIHDMKKPDLLKAVNRALESKGKKLIDPASIPLPTGKAKGRTTINLPWADGVSLQIVAEICVLDCRLVELRGFDGFHSDRSMCCCLELEGEPALIAQALRLFIDLSDGTKTDVRLHYIYKSIDRCDRTLQQVIAMATNS